MPVASCQLSDASGSLFIIHCPLSIIISGLRCRSRESRFEASHLRAWVLRWPAALLAMLELDPDLRISLADMPCKTLGEIDRAMLSARTSERDTQIGKAPAEIVLDRTIDQCDHRMPVMHDRLLPFEELDDRGVAAAQLAILVIPPRVV